MAKDLAIVLNAGGVNSAVVTALAAQKYRPVLLHAETAAQPGDGGVRGAFGQQVAHFKPYREHTLSMPFLALLGQPASQAAAAAAAPDPRQRGMLGPQLRELLPLLSAAAQFAAHYQAAAIYLGLRVGGSGDELAQATEYIQIWNELLQIPCQQPDVELLTPLLELEAWQVVDLGFQVAAPFEKAWSCVEDAAEPCWACRGCRAREAAFQQAAKPDPTRGVKKI